MIVRVDACVVAIAPENSDGVVAHLLHAVHLEGGLVHLKRVRLLRVVALLWHRTMRSGAAGAGAFVAQIRDRVLTAMAVFPVDLDAFRFGDSDVFGIQHDDQAYGTRSTSRIPDMRRTEVTTRSSCFLSRISTVISITAPSPPRLSSGRASRPRMLLCSATSTEVS